MEQKQLILCDTNIFIEIYRGNIHILNTVMHIGQEYISISDVSCAELLFGARNKKELLAIRKDLNNLNTLSIIQDISTMAVELVEKYSISHKLALPDALIAATALHYELPLYTLNLKDFRFIDKIRLYHPSAIFLSK